ncbi:hypothetical protein [Oceanospirillum maris]|jgi:hypothetical protein|uniref:hypothetical protein n=1 Tax=Oceanospirillum maris TaxID=64977 RepID=UPI0004182156|nr:hypothetical protein [Oceanospirillum maris]
MTASSLNSTKRTPNSLRAFLESYASLPFRHHVIVTCVFLVILGAVKLLISISQPEGVWWDALSTVNLFVVISALMYGAIFFSQVFASIGAQVMMTLFPSEKAASTGCVIGVLASGGLIMFLAPYVLDAIWRL